MPYSLYAFLTDAVLVLFVLIGAFLGYRHGFIRTVAKPVKVIIALVLAFTLCTSLADAWLQPIVQAPIERELTVFLQERCANITAENAVEALPTVLKMAAGMFGINVSTLTEGDVDTIIGNVVTALAEPLAHLIALIGAFLIIYLLAKLLLSVGVSILHSLFSSGLLGVANRLVGLLVNTVLFLLIAWGAVALADGILSTPSLSDNTLVQSIQGAFFYRLLSENGPLDLLLSF